MGRHSSAVNLWHSVVKFWRTTHIQANFFLFRVVLPHRKSSPTEGRTLLALHTQVQQIHSPTGKGASTELRKGLHQPGSSPTGPTEEATSTEPPIVNKGPHNSSAVDPIGISLPTPPPFLISGHISEGAH